MFRSCAVGLSAFCLSLSTAGAAQALEFASQRDGVDIRAVDALPANPSSEGDGCGAQVESLETEGGKIAADAGWIVTDEITQAELTFISFVGQATAGTSGSCLMEGGNIGIFRGPDLLALAYAAEDAPRQIGSLQLLESGALRIWDGDYGSSPLADLRVTGDLVLIRPIADRDSFCAGKVTLPSLYALPIHQARILLLAEGWQPQPAAEPSPSDYVRNMAESLPELEDCSGTGFGYCGYNYSHEGGARLSVTSAGEGLEGSSPRVVDYRAACE